MSKIIKKFSDFQSTNEDFSLSSVFSSAGTALTDVAKGKLIEYLYGYFGVKPDSLLGTILTNFVEQVSISEYPQFISGEINVKDMAPKLADATIETIADLGIDGIATRFKLEDKQGWIYRTFKEMLSNQARKNDMRETLIGIWTFILGGSLSGSEKAFSSSAGKNPLSVTPEEAQQLASNPAVQKAAGQQNMNPIDLITNLMGGSSARGVIGQ